MGPSELMPIIRPTQASHGEEWADAEYSDTANYASGMELVDELAPEQEEDQMEDQAGPPYQHENEVELPDQDENEESEEELQEPEQMEDQAELSDQDENEVSGEEVQDSAEVGDGVHESHSVLRPVSKFAASKPRPSQAGPAPPSEPPPKSVTKRFAPTPSIAKLHQKKRKLRPPPWMSSNSDEAQSTSLQQPNTNSKSKRRKNRRSRPDAQTRLMAGVKSAPHPGDFSQESVKPPRKKRKRRR